MWVGTCSVDRLTVSGALAQDENDDPLPSGVDTTGLGRKLLIAFLGNMNHMPIRLAAFRVSRHLSGVDPLIKRLTLHYLLSWNALGTAISLVGSLDIVFGLSLIHI